MEKFELELKATCSGFNWLLATDKDTIQNICEENKHIDSLHADALYGKLYWLYTNNFDLFHYYEDLNSVMANSAFCGNILYLNGFEGYLLTDRLKVSGLFLNKSNCCIAIVEDIKTDKSLYFIVD